MAGAARPLALACFTLALTAPVAAQQAVPTPPTANTLSGGSRPVTLGKPAKNGAAAVEAVAFSRDRKTLASAHRDHTLRVWDVVERKELRRFRGHDKPVTALAFSPDGKAILTASEDGSAALWDVGTGKRRTVLAVESERVLHAAYAPDGIALAWNTDGRHIVRVREVATGRERQRFVGHTSRVLCARPSPDGKLLATTEKDSVRLWDARRGDRQRTAREGA